MEKTEKKVENKVTLEEFVKEKNISGFKWVDEYSDDAFGDPIKINSKRTYGIDDKSRLVVLPEHLQKERKKIKK